VTPGAVAGAAASAIRYRLAVGGEQSDEPAQLQRLQWSEDSPFFEQPTVTNPARRGRHERQLQVYPHASVTMARN
jgi:hypothetical protein